MKINVRNYCTLKWADTGLQYCGDVGFFAASAHFGESIVIIFDYCIGFIILRTQIVSMKVFSFTFIMAKNAGFTEYLNSSVYVNELAVVDIVCPFRDGVIGEFPEKQAELFTRFTILRLRIMK